MFINLLHRGRVTSTVIRGLRIVFMVLPVLVFGWLANENLVLTPNLSYSYHPGQHIHIVGPATPTALLKTADPKLRWRISVDNFLFHVTIPRLIEAVRLRVRLDPGTQSNVALTAGGVKGLNISTIISNAALDTLDWKHVSAGHVTLWMRDKRVREEKITTGLGKKAITKTITTERAVDHYDSIDAFRVNPPDMNTVGLVGVERMAFATVKDYHPSPTPVSIGHTLRGSHQVYVYAANENLKLAFDKIDLNRSKGTDGVTVRIARADDLTTSGRSWLKTVTVGDDGISGTSGIRGKAQPVVIEIPNVAAGVYFIDISTSEDVLLANFISSQRNLSFNGSVYIADGPAYAEPNFTPVVLQTNGSLVSVAANHDQGKQDVLIAGKKVAVTDVKVNHIVSNLSGTTIVNMTKGDGIVTGDGLLSFGGFELLPDGARNVDVSTATPDLSAVDYILADYVPKKSGQLEVDQTYKLDDLDVKGKTLTFRIDSPGLQASGATLGLEDIKVTLIRGPFPWHKVWEKLFGLKKTP